MKQTAVDWLFQELWDRPKDKMVWFYIFEKAKQIEKQQIIESWMSTDNPLQRISAEQYYKETYEKDVKIYKRISDMPEFINPIGTDTLNE